jgi:hypothetical protein
MRLRSTCRSRDAWRERVRATDAVEPRTARAESGDRTEGCVALADRVEGHADALT